MLYRRLAVLSLVVILGYFIAGCGGGGKGITQSISPQSTCSPAATAPPPVATSEQRAEWARKAAGLHRDLEFTYSTSGYPADGGFTAVALNENYEQFAAGEQDFNITVSDMNTVLN